MSSPPEADPHSTLTQGPQPIPGPSWAERYGEKFRFQRITDFPTGIQAPRRVRIYRRGDGLLLQWWDPGRKRNTAERIDGDLVSAIVRARQIEERLMHFKTGQPAGRGRLAHAELVAAFLSDLHQRADAGDIDPATVRRYAAALNHYLDFCSQPDVARAFPHASGVNRDFRLQLAAFLSQRQATSNGRAQGQRRPLKGQTFILDTVRGLFEWAADSERGNLLPEGFRNPFLRSSPSRSFLQGDPLAEPDITLNMALDFVAACDRFQLRLFMPILLFGLRAAEPCYLFREYFDGDWLRVPNNLELHYRTKGRRDKRFPLLDALHPFWQELRQGRSQGLLYERRSVIEGREQAALRGASLAEFVAEYRRRCVARGSATASHRQQLRDAVLREAGALTYDHIQGELTVLARRLHWPRKSTLKDFRHLFATTMNNAAMPESYRRYLMGQAPGRAALVAYTHLHELQRHYEQALHKEWMPLLTAINRRLMELASPGR
jgi:hypothetical protein